MGSETRAITDGVAKQIVTIFSKTCNKCIYFMFTLSAIRSCDALRPPSV